MKMKKIVFCFAMVLAAVAATGADIYAQGPPPVLVAVDTVKEAEFHDQVTLVGRTEASVESRIVSEVYGRVKAVNAGEGTWVKKGSPLVTVDADRIHYQLASKKAEAEQARLRAELAETQKIRAEEMFEQNLISNTGIDSAVAWATITEQNFQQLNAEAMLLELDYKRSVITAPFSGHTGESLVDVGEWVNPGMPVFEMVDISNTTVRVDLPERYFGRLEIGSEVIISRSVSDGVELRGVVSGIAPNASEETHTFPVIIEVPNSNGALGGGMLVRATLSLDDQFTSLAVSKDAVVRQGNQSMVYTVRDGKAAAIPVVTTSTDGEYVAVTAQGLTPGMQVIVRGNERVFPGSPVQVPGAAPEQPKPESSETTAQAAVTE